MKKLNITKLRKSLKMTQLDFCNQLGISQSYLSELENKKKPLTIELYNNILTEFGEQTINEFTEGNSDIIAIEINGRIKKIINDNFDGSIPEFCNKLNLRQATIITTLEQNIPAPHEVLMAIIRDLSLNINSEWLLTGKGDMLKQLISTPSTQTNATYIRTQGNDVYLETSSGIKYFELSDNKYRMRVPLVPFSAYARYANDACTPLEQEKETWDEVEFIVDKIGHGNYMGFEIKGDSMDDDSKRSFTQGDLVLARELDKTHWKDGLRYEKFPFWIIVLEGTILCKQITSQDIETGDITCHSLNPSPEYSDFTINLSKVCRIFNIIQKTSTAF